MPTVVFRVTGLREFRDQLRAAAPGLQKELRVALNEIGTIIVDAVKPKMEAEFVTPASERTGALLDSVRAQSTQTEGRVMIGTPVRLPYAGWWEFGGSTKSPRGNTNRTFIKEGRTLYPTAHEMAGPIGVKLEEIVDRLADRING